MQSKRKYYAKLNMTHHPLMWPLVSILNIGFQKHIKCKLIKMAISYNTNN